MITDMVRNTLRRKYYVTAKHEVQAATTLTLVSDYYVAVLTQVLIYEATSLSSTRCRRGGSVQLHQRLLLGFTETVNATSFKHKVQAATIPISISNY
ncbi:hypothetical protein J6590_016757 [Homalodisca vitripennis]|nr:hypothetical protein J6590_016757 [Homalodisca vitripennis]